MADAELGVAPEPKRVTRLIRLKEVQHRVGLGRSTIYRWMAEGKGSEAGPSWGLCGGLG